MYFLLTVLTPFAAAYPDFRFLTKPHHAENFALNLTLLRGFFDDLKFTGIGQGWASRSRNASTSAPRRSFCSPGGRSSG
ncbi:MAG: hypothetical protein R3F11_32950 [Verrucomicrobiales bacterium]